MQETQVPFLSWEDTLEKEMATRSSILPWKIPWTEEPGGLQSMGPQRVRHDGACTCAYTKDFNTLLNRSGESGYLCLIADFSRKAFSFLLLSVMLTGFVMNSFYHVEIRSLSTHFGKSFSHEWMLNLSNAFSASIVMIKWFLSFLLLMWCITLINLCMLNHPCDPGMNPAWSWYLIFFIVVGFGLLIFCWRFLHLYSSKILACNFLIW